MNDMHSPQPPAFPAGSLEKPDRADTLGQRFVSRLQFPKPMEQAFQEDYDRKVLPGLRGGLLLLFVLFFLQALSAIVLGHGIIRPVWISAGAILLLLLASLYPRFLAWWEPAVVVTFCGLAWLLLHSVARQAPPPDSGAAGAFRANTLLLNELQVIIAGCALTRLRFLWFAAASLTIFGTTLVVAYRTTGAAF